ncbi:MAG: hypothetical protein ACREDJ_09165, partial [Methylocella sp.]
MPELGTLSREQVAALAGLAPFDDDSGKRPFGGLRRKPPYRRWTRSPAKKSPCRHFASGLQMEPSIGRLV